MPSSRSRNSPKRPTRSVAACGREVGDAARGRGAAASARRIDQGEGVVEAERLAHAQAQALAYPWRTSRSTARGIGLRRPLEDVGQRGARVLDVDVELARAARASWQSVGAAQVEPALAPRSRAPRGAPATISPSTTCSVKFFEPTTTAAGRRAGQPPCASDGQGQREPPRPARARRRAAGRRLRLDARPAGRRRRSASSAAGIAPARIRRVSTVAMPRKT